MNATNSPLRHRGWLYAWACALVLALPAALMACPNCKLSMEGGDGGGTGLAGESGSMAAGYAYSIYLMLGVVAVLASGLVWFIRREAGLQTSVVLPGGTRDLPNPTGALPDEAGGSVE